MLDEPLNKTEMMSTSSAPSQTKVVDEADMFMDERSNMLAAMKDDSAANNPKGLVQLVPMSPLSASSTVVNLLLATGPFSYPFSYVGLGPILSSIIMLFCCVLAYISATYMVEAVSMANSQDDERRRDSIFKEEAYATPALQRRSNDPDLNNKDSEFYVRQKIELGVIADRIARPWVKYTIMGILIVYMYGAMCLKYVAGAESLYQGISFLAYENTDTLEDKYPWVYVLSIIFFEVMCCAFSFGDIENSKYLQIFSAFMRVFSLILMYIGMFIYLKQDGTSIQTPVWNWAEQSKSLATVFGNTVFVFIYHHSIPGIMYPVRPQAAVGQMFLTANIVASILLFAEGFLAFLVFSGLPNSCTPDDHSKPTYPCQVNPLFTENFNNIPFIGQICQFYPLLNISAVPILLITLRNNFMQVVPVKRWIRQAGCCKFLLDDHKRSVKGIWAIIFSLPVVLIVMFVRDPQVLISYTGGICGPFILFLIPITLVKYGREKLGDHNKQNFNRSPYQQDWLMILIAIFAFITLGAAVYGAASGTAGE